MQTGVILVVEDNQDEAALTLRAIQKNHITNPVVLADNGFQALDYLFGTGDYAEHHPPLPQLILMDLDMPRMHGLEVLRRIRLHDRTKHLPVVIMTASIDEDVRQRSYELFANHYIAKPVNFADFLETIRQLGHRWLNHESAKKLDSSPI
jgi:two-component system, response regulator